MTAQDQQQLATACDDVADLTRQALAWIEDPENADLVGAETKSLVQSMRRAGRRARRLAKAAQTRMSVSVFGPSQAGKSFLVSVLARPESGPLIADFGGTDGTLDYIREINPEGEGESTGLVTRFTMDRCPTPDGYPVRLTLLSVPAALILAALFGLALHGIVGESVEAARDAQAERDTLDRIVASATGVAIIVTDEQSRISLFNPGAERMLGYRAEEVLGRSTSMLHSPAAVEAAAAQLGVAPDFRSVAGELLRRGVAPVEMGFTRADGVDRTHSMTLSRVTDDQGKVVGYVSTSEDVTDRIETEEALREALERMREVDAVKDAFVSSVSHELRTPITSIHGYLEMLLDETLGELSPAQRSAVEKVESNSRRLLGLIDDLLTLSRLQEDGLNLAPRVVDLRTLVGDACEVVAPAAETGGLRLRVSVPEEPMPFLGERDMLERALVNLVGNAVKFTPGGGEVEVSLLPREEGSVVVVRDTGIGIPLAEQEHLFPRFFRSSLAQRQAIPGSGLGLSIARAVVHQHGGTLRVESAEGVGTTFYVELPALV